MSAMKRYAVPALFGIALLLIVAAIVPMWTMTAGVTLTREAIGYIVLMIIGCSAVGGGLMFLIFYSARHGYDDNVRNDIDRRDPDQS